MRPPVRERPVWWPNCARQGLIAAILLPVIRANGTTHVGACREWPMPKPTDDRRGIDSVRPERAQFRRSTRVAAADAVPTLNTAAFSGLPTRRRDVGALPDVSVRLLSGHSEPQSLTSEAISPSSEIRSNGESGVRSRTDRMKALVSSRGSAATLAQNRGQVPSCRRYCSTLDT
jgi:hypothetical protein